MIFICTLGSLPGAEIAPSHRLSCVSFDCYRVTKGIFFSSNFQLFCHYLHPRSDLTPLRTISTGWGKGRGAAGLYRSVTEECKQSQIIRSSKQCYKDKSPAAQKRAPNGLLPFFFFSINSEELGHLLDQFHKLFRCPKLFPINPLLKLFVLFPFPLTLHLLMTIVNISSLLSIIFYM